ncbi:MAG: cytochrome C oxidase subunit IV family protein [Halobacteriovoraceae bacterium]|nr:cytochrome C oxidase subunit IV family protein [Halobacteriovoraceae bacterium]
MAEKSHRKEYFLVFLLLTFLTVVELIIPGLDTAYFFKASSLTLLALGKAFCVAYYYMHLKDEAKWLWFIAAIPISAAIYATVVVLESLYR